MEKRDKPLPGGQGLWNSASGAPETVSTANGLKPQRGEELYEGKAKIIYKTDDPDLLIAYFKDDATAFNNQKKGSIGEKGIMNNAISSKLFELLAKQGIKNHFVKKLSDREMLVKKLDMLALEVLVRNVAAGSLAKRMGVEWSPIILR